MGYTKSIYYRGLEVSAAYHRIDTTSSADGTCTANVSVYASRQAFVNGEGYIDQMRVEYPISYGIGAVADKNQGYAYLLELLENANAVSVFEIDQPD